MNVIETELPGVFILQPKVFGDSRGYFLETWNQTRHREAGITEDFVQDNLSHSSRGVLRGLHFQNPNAQAKLLNCCKVKSSMSRWISASAHLPSVAGSAPRCPPTTSASSMSEQASPTGFALPAKQRYWPISALTSTIPRQRAAYCGTILILELSGLSVHPCYRIRTGTR